MDDKEHELVHEEDCWPRCRCGWMPDCGLHSRNTAGVFAIEKHVLQANARRSTVASGRWVPGPKRESASLFHALELLEREASLFEGSATPPTYTTRGILDRIQGMRDEFLGRNDD